MITSLRLLSLFLGISLLLLLSQQQQLCSLAVLAVSAASGYVEAHLAWLQTAKPAGIKLHPQLCQLLGRAGAALARCSAAAITISSPVLVPAALGSLGAAFVLGGAPAGLALFRVQLYLSTLPVLLAYAALATAYRWQLAAIAFLWDVFCGRRWLLAPGPQLSALGPAAKSNSNSARHPGSPPRAQAAPGSVLPQHPSLADLTASILLLAPPLLLLPTVLAFYGLACALHSVGLAARAATAVAAWALEPQAEEKPELMGERIRPAAAAADESGAGTQAHVPVRGWLQRVWGGRIGFGSRPMPNLRQVLGCFACGVPVGVDPGWPS